MAGLMRRDGDGGLWFGSGQGRSAFLHTLEELAGIGKKVA
jgi:hypothetical protein